MDLRILTQNMTRSLLNPDEDNYHALIISFPFELFGNSVEQGFFSSSETWLTDYYGQNEVQRTFPKINFGRKLCSLCLAFNVKVYFAYSLWKERSKGLGWCFLYEIQKDTVVCFIFYQTEAIKEQCSIIFLADWFKVSQLSLRSNSTTEKVVKNGQRAGSEWQNHFVAGWAKQRHFVRLTRSHTPSSV